MRRTLDPIDRYDDFPAPPREKPAGVLDGLADGAHKLPRTTPGQSPFDGKTPGQRTRRKRDLLIYWAHRNIGLSERWLAEAVGLPRSRVNRILRDLDAEAAAPPDATDPESE